MEGTGFEEGIFEEGICSFAMKYSFMTVNAMFVSEKEQRFGSLLGFNLCVPLSVHISSSLVICVVYCCLLKAILTVLLLQFSVAWQLSQLQDLYIMLIKTSLVGGYVKDKSNLEV